VTSRRFVADALSGAPACSAATCARAPGVVGSSPPPTEDDDCVPHPVAVTVSRRAVTASGGVRMRARLARRPPAPRVVSGGLGQPGAACARRVGQPGTALGGL